MDNALTDFYKKIVDDDLDGSFVELNKVGRNNHLDEKQKIFLQSLNGRWNSLHKEKLAGTIEAGAYRKSKNEIRLSLLTFAKSLEKPEFDDQLQSIEEKIETSDEHVVKVYQQLKSIQINRNIFILFVLLFMFFMFLGFLYIQSLTYRENSIDIELYTRDNQLRYFKDLTLKTNINTVDNIVFDSTSCAQFSLIAEKYPYIKEYNFHTLSYLKDDWGIDSKLPTWGRLKEALEDEQMNEILSTEERLSIFCNSTFWGLLDESMKVDKEPTILVMPKKPQHSIVYLYLEGDNIQDLKLKVNSKEDEFSKLIRQYSAQDGIINIDTKNEEQFKLCLLVGERLDFKTDEGYYKIGIERISNPGSWREPYLEAEDIVTINLKFEKHKS